MDCVRRRGKYYSVIISVPNDLFLHFGKKQIWLPLIMMFSGMRCNEIAQHYVDDIQEREDIHYFRIADNVDRKQHIKTPTSKRDIPIHSKLKELGLLALVARMKEAGQNQLFPNFIYRSSIKQYYDSQTSTQLNLPINAIDNDDKLRLYSLRANFRNSIEEKFINHIISAMDRGDSSTIGSYSRYYDLALNNIMGHTIKGTVGDTQCIERKDYKS